MVEGEQQDGGAHLGADLTAVMAQPEPRAGVDLAGHPELGPPQILLADHPAVEPDQEVDAPLQRGPNPPCRLGVGPRRAERHELRPVHSADGFRGQLEQTRVVVGTQLQTRRAQDQAAQRPRIG